MKEFILNSLTFLLLRYKSYKVNSFLSSKQIIIHNLPIWKLKTRTEKEMLSFKYKNDINFCCLDAEVVKKT